MKLKPLASNLTELELENVTIYFSYKTPVAGCDANGDFFRTSTHYSPTTTKHIKKALGRFYDDAYEMTPAQIEGLLQ